MHHNEEIYNNINKINSLKHLSGTSLIKNEELSSKTNNIKKQKDFSKVASIVDQRLSLEIFSQFAGHMTGYSFVKVVVDRRNGHIHFMNNNVYAYHADYVAEHCLDTPRQEMRKHIDDFNRKVYLSPDRDFYLGLVALHKGEADSFFTLETVEIDNLNKDMLLSFFKKVKENIDPNIPLVFKPANNDQEDMVQDIGVNELPRVLIHELFESAPFVPLNAGTTKGRLRIFKSKEEYKQQFDTIEWYDIIVMDKVPDDIPRVAGIINSSHTTPLSHTNVLAHGWKIPNAVQKNIIKYLEKEDLDNKWIEYTVDNHKDRITINQITKPNKCLKNPSWRAHVVKLETPEVNKGEICNLINLRMSDNFQYGTKAANLGELGRILLRGSSRLTGYYRIPRPPRTNLLSYLAERLGVGEGEDLQAASVEYLRNNIVIPQGIAIPFSLQREFLESSPAIQQCIGKLKMALELNANEVGALCIKLQSLIRKTRFSDEMREYIDSQIAMNLGGVTSFVVRSSSNAEDLSDFSAAGIYESINHVTTAENIFNSIKEVWASLVSPRSVRLRHQVGISLDDSYMGVIIQEEIKTDLGGVLVTSNPLDKSDIRNVYINISTKSVETVVDGSFLPIQYLYNTLEGGSRTLTLGDAKEDLSPEKRKLLQKLAFAGRLLQSHFSKDYTFNTPADIEWAIKDNHIYILQLRPYSG